MLRTLSIRDVVLIEKLDLDFGSGLMVLTGETGAGKSILLDALGLALGVRAESRLVRHGADQAVVTAEFDLSPAHPAWAVAAEGGLDAAPGEPMILRRALSADGRSRAYLNDQAVSVGLLRQLGDTLVEVHGQFESQRLLNPVTHRALLDGHGGLDAETAAVRNAFKAWQGAQDARMAAAEKLKQARRDEDFLRHALDELSLLSPAEGEEEELAAKRAVMMHAEKLAEALNGAAASLNDGPGAEAAIQGAARQLERVAVVAEGRLDDVVQALDRAAGELAEAQVLLDRAAADMEMDPAALDKAEERLFALRACARKHGVEVDGLPDLQTDLQAQLDAVEDGGAALAALEKAEAEARAAYDRAADVLGVARRRAAESLDKAVSGELEPLKLGQAAFITSVEVQDESAWGSHGKDAVAFQVATNAGQPAGPLGKVASGGELARFMLALKVVLAQADPVTTLVFDEVDAGIGGATAAAVGDRLARLAADVQVLVVTHSPQVAAQGNGHLQVAKSENGESVTTSVSRLDDAARREEIARMLAGAEVTEEARAAADTLMAGGGVR